MKITRVLFAAIALVVTFAACDSHPTGVGENDPSERPVIGSGVGT